MRRREFVAGVALVGVARARVVCVQEGGGFDVRDFGARGDGRSLDTSAINRAIDAAAAAGGGRVYVPAGSYLCHSIHLKSHGSLDENAYPEPGMFGPMPAHGLYARHVKSLEVTNFEVAMLDEDARPAFALVGVRDADLSNLRMPEPPGGVPFITLRDVEEFSIERSEPVPGPTLERVEQRTL